VLSVDVRLNRALEETEKYKDALQKAKADMSVGRPFYRRHSILGIV